MPRANVDKAYRAFLAGVVTEATELTFPENSCREIINCDLDVSGSIRRRGGLVQETDGGLVGGPVSIFPGIFKSIPAAARASGPYSLSSAGVTGVDAGELAVTVHEWRAPGGRSDLMFLVFQIGNRLVIRDGLASAVSSLSAIAAHYATAAIIPYFDLDAPASGVVYNTSWENAARVPLRSTTGFNRIWFTSPAVVPFYLEYDPSNQNIAVWPVGVDSAFITGRLSIRDFTGVDDGLAPNVHPATLSEAHRYNLQNQGWIPAHYTTYQSVRGHYPSNAQQWILGKNSSDAFDANLLASQDFGNGLAPRGRATLHALAMDRTINFIGTHLTTAAYNTPSTSGFRCTAFYAGRLWLAGDDNPFRGQGLFFSKTIESPRDAGILRSENDPTSEHFSDLLATDGGVIPIAEAVAIQRLIPVGAGLLVLAQNGVWFVSGGVGAGSFAADNYSVDKLSSIGCVAADSVALVENSVLFFSENSIQAVSTPAQGLPEVQDISAKIFSLYADILPTAKVGASAAYDPVNKRVYWSYLKSGGGTAPYYDMMLVLDVRLGAFTVHDFSGEGGGVPLLGHSFGYRGVDDTQDGLRSIVYDLAGAGLRIGRLSHDTFQDFFGFPIYVPPENGPYFPSITPQDYVSTLTTGWELLDDLQRDKQATYLHSFFRKTEDGHESDGMGGFIPTSPSACEVRGKWNWQNSAAGGRWGPYQQAYLFRRPHIPSGLSDPLDNGEGVVYTKVKVRGKGRSLSLQYQSVGQNDFQLLGYSVSFTANGV